MSAPSRTTSGAGERPSSPISPTISSTRSSTVTIPAVSPYSSITMAICCFFRCISLSSSEPCFVSGTNSTGRTISRTVRRDASGSGMASGRARTRCRYYRRASFRIPAAASISSHQQLLQLLQCGRRSDGHHVRPRRHYLAHALVAELHHLLDQLGVLRPAPECLLPAPLPPTPPTRLLARPLALGRFPLERCMSGDAQFERGRIGHTSDTKS